MVKTEGELVDDRKRRWKGKRKMMKKKRGREKRREGEGEMKKKKRGREKRER